MLTIRLDDRDLKRMSIALATLPRMAKEAMRRAQVESLSEVLTHMAQTKLTGQVLNRITGRLIRSWALIPPVIVSDGVVGGIGSNVKYAAYHEFGFHGVMNVRAHGRRKSKLPASMPAAARAQRPVATEVKAHRRAVSYKSRPYARPSLTEMRDRIAEIHSHFVRVAWENATEGTWTGPGGAL